MPESKTNEKKAKTSYTSELLCSSIVDPPQHANIIEKYDSGTSNNHWHTEDMLVLTNIKQTRNGPTLQLLKYANMNATKNGASYYQEV